MTIEYDGDNSATVRTSVGDTHITLYHDGDRVEQAAMLRRLADVLEAEGRGG